MANVARNAPPATIEADPLAAMVDAFSLFFPWAIKRLRAEVRAELVAVLDERAEEIPPPADGIVSGPTLDRVLAISAATRNRLAKEGLPFVHVGARRRYDVATCREWLAARGRKPASTERARGKADPIDISSITRRAGLRAVGGR
jgi:hypothetical protein